MGLPGPWGRSGAPRDVGHRASAATIPGVGLCKVKLKRFGSLARLEAALHRIGGHGMGAVLGDGLGAEIRARSDQVESFDGPNRPLGQARRAARCGSSGKRRNAPQGPSWPTDGRVLSRRGGVPLTDTPHRHRERNAATTQNHPGQTFQPGRKVL